MSDDAMLRLTPEEGTVLPEERSQIGRAKFYESSVRHLGNGLPLVSLAVVGDGLRLTCDQVEELRNWLTDWLEERMPA